MYSPIQLLLNQIGGLVTVNQKRKANEFQMISEHVHTLFQSKSQLKKRFTSTLDRFGPSF